jgi:hypothetical protein
MRLVISGPKFLNIIFQISVGKKMLLIYRSKPLNAEISSCFLKINWSIFPEFLRYTFYVSYSSVACDSNSYCFHQEL